MSVNEVGEVPTTCFPLRGLVRDVPGIVVVEGEVTPGILVEVGVEVEVGVDEEVEVEVPVVLVPELVEGEL